MGNSQQKAITSGRKRRKNAESTTAKAPRSVGETENILAHNVGGFGQFVMELKELFTVENAIRVATVLEFSVAQRDRIVRGTVDGHELTKLLQEKGVISPTEISPLIGAIKKCGLHGIAEKAQESFARNTSSFGQFVIELQELFTAENALSVATVLEVSSAQRDRIARGTVVDGHVFTGLLQEKGIVSPTDISPLIDAIEKCGLHGIADNVKESFARTVLNSIHPSNISPELQRRKEQLLEEIIDTYKDIYNRVQRVPYIREGSSCVNKVFIDSGIEFLANEGGRPTDRETWEKLGSYNSVLTDPRLAHAMVFLLYGEPGYGKSTLALQYVYDWCNSCPDSPLKDVEMLIFLRLKYLKGGVPIFKAVKEFLLPSDTKLTERDIGDIVHSCTSVLILFDGLDEYSPHHDVSKDDVMKIIMRKMFRDFKVILTARPSSSTPDVTHKTAKVRLTGFDDQAKERYILKAVVDGNAEAAAKILQRLQQNAVLADICQIPLFCAMFAHLAHQRETSLPFHSVTSFLRHVVSCSYEHAHIRSGSEDSAVETMHPTNHHPLDKVAFESLRGKDQTLVWGREILMELIGESLYNELTEVGILIEEKVLRIVDKPGTVDLIQRGTDVTFYHKLFCEWYAAHYVADYLNGPEGSNLQKFFEHMNPFDLQYVYRVACGLNPGVAKKIIQYLHTTHTIEGGDKFAILCILEQTGDLSKIMETIREICDEGVIISGHDSLLLQRSTMQLLELAARNDITIGYVHLHNCLQSVDLSTAAIRTTSGLELTSRIPVKQLAISLYNREMTEDEAIAILQFSSMCPALRVLRYYGCVPPRSFNAWSILSTLKSRNVTVESYCSLHTPWYTLNLHSGRWQNNNDGSEPTEEDFERTRKTVAATTEGWTEEIHKRMVNRNREILSMQRRQTRSQELSASFGCRGKF